MGLSFATGLPDLGLDVKTGQVGQNLGQGDLFQGDGVAVVDITAKEKGQVLLG